MHPKLFDPAGLHRKATSQTVVRCFGNNQNGVLGPRKYNQKSNPPKGYCHRTHNKDLIRLFKEVRSPTPFTPYPPKGPYHIGNYSGPYMIGKQLIFENGCLAAARGTVGKDGNGLRSQSISRSGVSLNRQLNTYSTCRNSSPQRVHEACTNIFVDSAWIPH